MYENLSDDEEEKEMTEIKQNSKLNQGKIKPMSHYN